MRVYSFVYVDRGIPVCMTPIGIVGPMGAGKDFIASVIATMLRLQNLACTTVAFGDSIYRIAASEIGVPIEDVRSNKARYLDILQKVGARPDAQRTAIAEMHTTLLRCKREGVVPIVVFRRPSEEALLRVHGGSAVFIDAPEDERIARITARDGVAPTSAALLAPTEPLHHQFPAIPRFMNSVAGGPVEACLDGSSIVFGNTLSEVVLGRSLAAPLRVLHKARHLVGL